MKTLSSVLLLAGLSLAIATCSKGDDVLQEENGEFIIDGERYGLHRGGIWYFMEHPDNVYNFAIELYSTGISGDFDEGISGYGDLASLMISSSNRYIPELGAYPIVSEDEVGNSGEAVSSIYTGVHRENNNEVAEKYFVCISGNLVFNKHNNEYYISLGAIGNEIDFNTDNILDENIEISINYKGNLLEQLADEVAQ